MALPQPMVPWREATSDQNSYSRVPSSFVNARVLAAAVAETITKPTGANWVIFSANVDFYANCYAAAAVPGADITDGSASELNPVAYQIPSDVASISVISPSAGIVTASFYS